MAALVADTHAAVWYLLNSKSLSSNAQRAMDEAIEAGDAVYVSSISLVEVVYLVEKGKLPSVVLDRLTVSFRTRFGLRRRSSQPFCGACYSSNFSRNRSRYARPHYSGNRVGSRSPVGEP